MLKRAITAAEIRGRRFWDARVPPPTSTADGDLGEGLRINLVYNFVKPPYGGGNQFFLALREGLRRQGAKVYANRFREDVDIHVCNSTWFDVERFERFCDRTGARMLHRIDGPIALYRGTDLDLDRSVFTLNERVATGTVLQSNWSKGRLEDLGFHGVRPTVIRNAVDPGIFHPDGRNEFSEDRKIRLISMSWSPNPRKGSAIYRWLDENLDFDRFEYTFLGRTPEPFENINVVPPVPSEGVASALRDHDVYITAGQNECCSNALIEALACGLPALYLDSGANAELVRGGGLPFQAAEEIPARLDRLVADYQRYQDEIDIEPLSVITRKYLETIRDAIE